MPKIYEQAVTTDRPAEMLAQRHGFGNIAQLAEYLPEHAQVLDVGAGASPFGVEMARRRPDISWTNVDYSYRNPEIRREVTANAPENVHHVAADATQLPFGNERFDAVFSYWLLPHLSLDTPEPAKAVAEAIFKVTKPDGFMSIGPKAGCWGLPALKARTIRADKEEFPDAATYAEHIVTATQLTGSARYIQKTANEVATPFFGTTRYTKRVGRIPYIYDPETGDYLNPFTPRSVRTAGRLIIAAARHTGQ